MKTKYNDLKGKTVLISGSEGILGKELVEKFLDQGSKLILVDILDIPDKYEFNDMITYFKCDISKDLEIKNLKEKIFQITPKVDVLINSATSKTASLKNFFKDFENYSIDTWKEVMSVNIDGPFLICQMLQDFLKKSNHASVINISSIYGVISPDNRIYDGSKYLGTKINSPAVYSVSKSALLGLSRYLSTYWSKFNIRVNSISPGGIENGQNETFQNNYSNRVPMKRMAKKNEIISVILFIASNDSSYITGQNIIVDGGLTIW